ncbi:MAG: TonB-dependent receptor domain-containing protein, partial [Gemmatimonadales bacterium]
SIDLREWSSNVLRQFGSNIFMAEPEYQSAYAQDRLDLGDVVIEFGIRWDRYDSGALFPQVPGRLFTHPAFDVNDPTISVDAPAGAATSTIYKVGESHTAWSPRLRVAFPITDQTGFRMSYSHQAQTPDFFNLYEGANNDLSQSNTNDRFGGDVDFAKTIMFEFGIRHAFSQDMVIDISAYNRDKVSDITYRILPFFDPFFDRINNVNILTNADFGNVRGIDFQIQRRFSNIFSGQVNYTFQNSKSTGSDPTDFLFGLSRQPAGVTGERPEAPQTTLRTRDDRRHNISGSWSLTFPSDYNVGLLSNVGVHGTFRFRSGLPYTRLLNTGNGSRSTGGFGLISNTVEALQSSETPWTKFLDVRVTKALGGLTLYADIRNLLDWENRTSVFSETGDITNDEFFREAFLDPQEQFLRSEATVSGVNTSVDTADGPVFAADLRGGCSGWLGAGGAVACHMLRQAEARFGNGDGIYDLDEHENAVRAWFIQGSGPHTFLGNGREIRVGAQLDF